MKRFLKQFSDLFEQNEEFQRRLGNYSKAVKSKDWEFLRDALLMIRGQMLADMFSRQHTKLSVNEKDVVQRTYFNINQMIDFLLDPGKWVKKQLKWKQSLTQLAGKVKPNLKKEK